jgi:hypothetical protein
MVFIDIKLSILKNINEFLIYFCNYKRNLLIIFKNCYSI